MKILKPLEAILATQEQMSFDKKLAEEKSQSAEIHDLWNNSRSLHRRRHNIFFSFFRWGGLKGEREKRGGFPCLVFQRSSRFAGIGTTAEVKIWFNGSRFCCKTPNCGSMLNLEKECSNFLNIFVSAGRGSEPNHNYLAISCHKYLTIGLEPYQRPSSLFPKNALLSIGLYQSWSLKNKLSKACARLSPW